MAPAARSTGTQIASRSVVGLTTVAIGFLLIALRVPAGLPEVALFVGGLLVAAGRAPAAVDRGRAVGGPTRLDGTDLAVMVALVAAVVMLAALRVHDRGFWYDEAFSATFVNRSWSDMVGLLGKEAGMGPYYVALWAWSGASDSEWWLRSFSVVGAAAAAVAAYALLRRWSARWMAALVVVAMQTQWTVATMTTEVRAYSWIYALTIMTVLAHARFVDSPSTSRSVAIGLSSGLLVANLAFALPMVVVQLLLTLRAHVRVRHALRQLALGSGVAVALIVPTLPALLSSDQLSWVESAGLARMLQLAREGLLSTPLGAITLLVGLGLLVGQCLERQLPTRGRFDSAVVVASVVAAPVSLALLSLARPAFVDRYVSLAVPLVFVGAGWGWARLSSQTGNARLRRAAPGVCFALMVLAGVPGIDRDASRSEDLELLSSRLRALSGPGVAVAFEPPNIAFAASYYWEPANLVGTDEGEAGEYDATPAAKVELATQLEPHCRVWIADRQTSPGDLERWTSEGTISYRESIAGFDLWLLERC